MPAQGGWNLVPHADSVLENAATDIDAEQFKAIDLYIDSPDAYIAKLEWINADGVTDSDSFLVRNRDGFQHYSFDLTKKASWHGKIEKLHVRFLSFDDYEGVRQPLLMLLPSAAKTANLLPAEFSPEITSGKQVPQQWNNAGGVWKLVLDTLLPNSEYRWIGPVEPQITVETFQGERKLLVANRDAAGELSFKLPLNSLRTEFITKAPATDCQLQLVKLSPPKLPAASTDDWRAGWIWYPEDATDNTYRYFRKIIKIDKLPEFARAYVTVDDGFKFFVNGVELATGKNWGAPRTVDILEELKAGQDNVIAVEAFNAAAGAGVRAEIIFGKKGATDQIMLTDATWQCSETKVPGWNNDPAVENSWKAANVVNGPEVPYEYVGTRSAITVDDVKTTASADGLLFDLKGFCDQLPAADSVLIAELTKGDKTFFFGRMTWRVIAPAVGKNPARIQITGAVPTNRLNEGDYRLRLKMPSSAFFGKDGSELLVSVPVTTEVVKKAFPTSSVRWVNQRPEILIDGKGHMPYFFHLSGGFVNTARVELPMVMDSAKNGVHFFAISNEYFTDRTWPEENTFDFSEYDNSVRMLLAADPNARVLLIPSMNMPQWWLKKYPNDVIATSSPEGVQSTPPMQSPASLQWREDGRRYLRELIKHLEQSDYAGAIMGIFPSALQTIEWVYPPTLVRTDADMTDYCVASTEGFRQFVQKKYPALETLREIYNAPNLNYAEVELPTPEALQAAEIGRFRDPKVAQAAIDYWEYRAETTADTLLSFCQTVKESSGRQLLSGSYFGYLVQFWPQQNMARSGHAMLEKVLNSKDVDALCAPADYLFRLGNSPASMMSPADSLRLNNKLWIQEDDIRGYLAQKSYSGADNTYYHGKTDTVADTLAILRKQFALNLAQGLGFWWFDLNGGFFTNPALNETLMGRWSKAEENLRKNPDALPALKEVAFVIDGHSSFMNKMAGGAGQIELRAQNKTFNMVAAPRDVIQLRDFEKGTFPPYKLYIFLNCFIVEPGLRDQIQRKLKENNALAAWVHCAGFFDGTPGVTPAVENISKLTGFTTRQDTEEGGVETEITVPGSPAVKWQFPGGTSPLFFIDDPKAETWSKKGSDINAGFKDMGGWRSVYFSSSYLSPDAIRFLCGKAGVQLYSPDQDYFYLGDGFFASNIVKSGVKKFSFPVSVDVAEFESGKILARNTREFSYPAESGETYLFAVSKSRPEVAPKK